MAELLDLVIKDAYLQGRDEIADIGVEDGQIECIRNDAEMIGDVEVDACGDLVSPGFVESHVHLDQALSRMGDRQPKHNDEPFSMERSLGLTEEYFEATSPESIEQTVVEVSRKAVSQGVLHARTHTYIDDIVGTKSVNATVSARKRLEGLFDLEIVAFPQQGVRKGNTEEILEASIQAGADLVGGLDPASLNRDIQGTLNTWFELATELDVDIDVHLHDPGSLGLYTLDRLVENVRSYGYEGRVTASHSFALADAVTRGDQEWIPDGSLQTLIERFASVGLKFVTCYLSTKPDMPIKNLQDNKIPLGHGSDQVRDHWLAHGNINPIEEMLIQSLNLGTDYEYTMNRNLDRIWQMVTTGGAAVLAMEDDYGIKTGTPADIVVHGSSSRQWTIIEQSVPRVVIKDGRIVARDGTIID